MRSYIDENFNIKQEADTNVRSYMRFFVSGDKHYFLGFIPSQMHLFGFDDIQPSSSEGQYYTRFYLLGSDLSGRDTFSRICYGARISMTIGLVGATIVLFIGMLIGGISGYFGGMVDNVLQRICEMVMLLPGFYLLLMLRFMFPADMDSVKVYFAVVFILALVGWAGLARVIRGMVLSIRTEDYVQAARAIGVRPLGIILKHVLPHTMTYAIVSFTLAVPSYILGEAALSLLGLGIMEPVPSWGNMLSKAMDISELTQHPWVLWPGAFIFITVLAFNLVGDGLRDALDPKLRKRE
jgi:peptide/nickel transport system permease protein